MKQNLKIKFQLVIYSVFLLVALLALPRIFIISDVISATRLQEIEKYIRYSELAFFVWTVLFVKIYYLSYLSLYYSNQPESLFFFPFFSRKYPRGKATISGKLELLGQPVALAKVLILDEAENEIGYFYANGSGDFRINIKPGKYMFLTEGFGFEGDTTKAIKVKASDSIDIELKCFTKEDVFVNPRSYHFLISEKYAFLLAAVLSPILGWFAIRYQSSFIGALIIITGIILFIVFALGQSQKLIIRNRKGARLKARELEISNSTGEKKHKVETDIFGNLIVLLSPGIYKISSRGCLPRNMRVKTRSIANANIKLG